MPYIEYNANTVGLTLFKVANELYNFAVDKAKSTGKDIPDEDDFKSLITDLEGKKVYTKAKGGERIPVEEGLAELTILDLVKYKDMPEDLVGVIASFLVEDKLAELLISVEKSYLGFLKAKDMEGAKKFKKIVDILDSCPETQKFLLNHFCKSYDVAKTYRDGLMNLLCSDPFGCLLEYFNKKRIIARNIRVMFQNFKNDFTTGDPADYDCDFYCFNLLVCGAIPPELLYMKYPIVIRKAFFEALRILDLPGLSKYYIKVTEWKMDDSPVNGNIDMYRAPGIYEFGVMVAPKFYAIHGIDVHKYVKTEATGGPNPELRKTVNVEMFKKDVKRLPVENLSEKILKVMTLKPYQRQALTFHESDDIFDKRKPLSLEIVTDPKFTLYCWRMMRNTGLSFDEVKNLSTDDFRRLLMCAPDELDSKAKELNKKYKSPSERVEKGV